MLRRVVALVSAFNEADIIACCISHLVAQDVSVYLLDNGSTDGTADCVRPFVGAGVHVEPFPPEGTGQSESWQRILERKEELAERLDADWFIHHDADEFRESPWLAMNLREAITAVDEAGYNAIDFEVFDFRPTIDTFQPGDDPLKAFPFYGPPFARDRLQIKCWKKQPARVDLHQFGGHDVLFPNRKVFPIRFILRHYPIRGQAHGERKIFQERRGRFDNERQALGWHSQYDHLEPGSTLVSDPSGLTRYDPFAARLKVLVHNREVDAVVDELAATAFYWRSAEARSQAASCRVRELEAEVLSGRESSERHQADAAREVAALARELADARAGSASLEERLAATQRQAADQDERLRTAAELLETARHEGRSLSTQVADAEAALSAAAARVVDFEQSRSWRWTAGLRAIYGLLHRR